MLITIKVKSFYKMEAVPFKSMPHFVYITLTMTIKIMVRILWDIAGSSERLSNMPQVWGVG